MDDGFVGGACLSYAITGIKSTINKEGICTLSDEALSYRIIRGGVFREFTLPILSLNQPIKELFMIDICGRKFKV